MNRLRQQIVEAIAKIESRQVIIVDDDAPSIDTHPFVAWIALRDILQANTPIYAEYLRLCEKDGDDLDTPPPVNRVREAVSVAPSPPDVVAAAVHTYIASKHVLACARDLLKDLGFSVEVYEKTPQIMGDSAPFLLLIDYHFEGEEYEGQNAEQTIQQLTQLELSVPPFVLLMSKRLDASQCDVWTDIANRAGFFRFNYDFLTKSHLEQNPAYLYFALLNFIQHTGLSKSYFQQMRTLEKEAKRVAESVTKELFQVTPSEAQMFRERMQVEGLPLAQVFVDLFAKQLSLRLSTSASVVDAMAAFERAVVSEGIPAVEIRECGSLHRLYSELLHQPASAEGGPRFGDIYKGAGGALALVLTQECDIASGEKREPKVDSVLILEGTFENREANKDDGPIISKPYSVKGEPILWIWWHLRKPLVVPYSSLSGKTHTEQAAMHERIALRAYRIWEQVGRPHNRDREIWGLAEQELFALNRQYTRFLQLRFSDAEEIQNTFAFQLARVGADVLPSPIERFSVRNEDENGQLINDLYFYRLRVNDADFMSLCPESKVVALGEAMHPLFSTEGVLKLSHFLSITKFRELLKTEKVFPRAENKQLVSLIKYTVKKPRNVSEWGVA